VALRGISATLNGTDRRQEADVDHAHSSDVGSPAERRDSTAPGIAERATPGRGAAIAGGLTWASRWSLRLALVALGLYLLWYVLAVLWVIVLPVLLAVLLATVAWPPVAWLRRRGLPPAVAAGLVMLFGLAGFGAVIVLLARSIGGGIPQIAASAVDGIERIRQLLAGPPLNLGTSQLNALLDQATQRLQQSVSTIAFNVLTGVGVVASGIVTALLAIVLAFLFVKDGPRFLPWLRGVVGPTAGDHLTEVLRRVWATLAGFVHTQAVVALIDAVLIGAGLLILGVPLALPLAVLTFLGGFVPIVGALVAGALAVLVALVSNGFTTALIVLGITVVVQQLEGYVLQPILQSRSLRLHAAVVLLAVTAGATLYGIGGAFLAVPVVAAAAVVLRYLGEQVDGRTGAGPARDTTSEDGADGADELGEPVATTGRAAQRKRAAKADVPPSSATTGPAAGREGAAAADVPQTTRVRSPRRSRRSAGRDRAG